LSKGKDLIKIEEGSTIHFLGTVFNPKDYTKKIRETSLGDNCQ